MSIRGIALLLAVCLSVSCGREGKKSVRGVNTSPAVEGRAATLYVFGGGFCPSCKKRFPEIQSHLDAIPEATKRNLKVVLYYVAGEPSSVRPTPELAEAYRLEYLPGAQALPDLPWRWTNFKRLLPGFKLDAPAAVLIDDKGAEVKRWAPGDTTFVPAEIVDTVNATIKKP